MLAIGSLGSDESSIAWRVSTVLTVIRHLSSVAALTDSRMCRRVTDLCRDSSIEGIEIAHPVTIIVLVYVFHYSAFEGVEISHTCLVHDH